jgi:hypothetical protein
MPDYYIPNWPFIELTRYTANEKGIYNAVKAAVSAEKWTDILKELRQDDWLLNPIQRPNYVHWFTPRGDEEFLHKHLPILFPYVECVERQRMDNNPLLRKWHKDNMQLQIKTPYPFED